MSKRKPKAPAPRELPGGGITHTEGPFCLACHVVRVFKRWVEAQGCTDAVVTDGVMALLAIPAELLAGEPDPHKRAQDVETLVVCLRSMVDEVVAEREGQAVMPNVTFSGRA